MDMRNVPRQGMPPSRNAVPPPPPNNYQPQGYAGGPQLFEDTSYAGQQQQGYGAPPGQGGGWQGYGAGPSFQPDQFLKDPMAAMAMQYGSQLAGQGQKMMNEKLEKYVSVSKLKYYFAVDTAYVCKKLALLLFPFSHTDWAVKYDQNEPVPPRYDVNAPDLYIPSMAFVTYILLSGYMLGLNDKFTPEQLGMQASTALMWLTLEVLVTLLATYVLSVNSSLRLFDIIAFSSYKFVSMISAMLAGLLLQSLGYWAVLGYTCLSLDFFLLRTLRIAVLSNPSSDQYGHNSRKGLYLLLGICILQPIMCYFMTYRLVRTPVSAE
ncbi:protein YIF1B-B-like isoform X2 [Ornithodoros turicata]|uniref:protein YIF1B-B-like isoform X2 n=1 Tax=Ornithodoros turicata TaxID=34597 RepID=UPI0031392BF6